MVDKAVRRPEEPGDEPGRRDWTARLQVAPPMTAVCDTRTGIRMLLRMSALDLRPLPSAVPSARLHARHVVCEWGFPAIASDCELLVAELVTNAVTHAARVVTAADLPPVRLRLSGRTRGVQIGVWDGSDEMPRPRSDPLEEGGRGLVLVAAIASRWGAYRTQGGGKCVWAVIGA